MQWFVSRILSSAIRRPSAAIAYTMPWRAASPSCSAAAAETVAGSVRRAHGASNRAASARIASLRRVSIGIPSARDSEQVTPKIYRRNARLSPGEEESVPRGRSGRLAPRGGAEQLEEEHDPHAHGDRHPAHPAHALEEGD